MSIAEVKKNVLNLPVNPPMLWSPHELAENDDRETGKEV